MKATFGGLASVCAFLAVLGCMSSTLRADSFLDKIYTTPDYCQTDSAYGGFPDDDGVLHGGVFCGPTSVSNALMWLDDNGFPNLAANTSDRKYDQHELIETIASDEYTDSYDNDGLSPYRLATGVSSYIHDCGYDYSQFEFQSWRSVPSAFQSSTDIPDLDWVREGIASPTGVVLCSVGWYDYHSDTKSYSREGGHWVTLVGYDEDQLIFHDPSPRTGYSLVNNYITTTEITDSSITFPGGKAEGYYLLSGWPINSVGDYAILDGVFVIDMVPVNCEPIALNDSYTVNEDSTLNKYNYEGVLINDTDDDGDSLEAIQYTDPAHGTLDLWSNGALVYTPDENYHGTDSFTYLAYDGTEYSDPATVTVDIISVNDVPVALDDSFETEQDKRLLIYTHEGLLINDSDADNTDDDPSNDVTLVAVLEDDVEHGLLEMGETGWFIYRPDTGFHGTDSFTYRVYDDEEYSELATVLIEVMALVAGDATGDSVVDAEDQGILDENWGQTVSGGASMGDFNDDGIVNAIDASILAANWGDHRESSGEMAVPEPSTLGLIAALSMFWLLVPSRRRK